MPRTVPRLIGAVAVLAALSAGTACSGGGDDEGGGTDPKVACENIQKEIANTSTAGIKQVSNPQGMAQTYRDGAKKIRTEGEKAGGDVEEAATGVANAFETLADAVSGVSATQPVQANTDELTNAGVKLKEVCGS